MVIVFSFYYAPRTFPQHLSGKSRGLFMGQILFFFRRGTSFECARTENSTGVGTCSTRHKTVYQKRTKKKIRQRMAAKEQRTIARVQTSVDVRKTARQGETAWK